MPFGVKNCLLNTQCGVRRSTPKSPIMKQANTSKEPSKKNSLKPNTASHNNASWHTDTDGSLEHSFVLPGTRPPEDNSGFYAPPTPPHVSMLLMFGLKELLLTHSYFVFYPFLALDLI